LHLSEAELSTSFPKTPEKYQSAQGLNPAVLHKLNKYQRNHFLPSSPWYLEQILYVPSCDVA